MNESINVTEITDEQLKSLGVQINLQIFVLEQQSNIVFAEMYRRANLPKINTSEHPIILPKLKKIPPVNPDYVTGCKP